MAAPPPPTKRQKREQYLSAASPTDLPKKRFYRQRAHANPFSDHQLTYPANPAFMDWSLYFPAYLAAPKPKAEGEEDPTMRPLIKPVTVADVGCGFGGLLVALSPILPDELILGLEIRTQVSTYTSARIAALRAQSAPTSAQTSYQNIACLRANTMKFLPNFFPRASLQRVFLCFPDPHFKARKHKARIVSRTLVAEYAFVVREGGWVYVITDVEDLFRWIAGCFSEQRGGEELWEEVGETEREADPCMRAVREETEEGRKVQRNGGEKFVGCWRRRADPEWPVEESGDAM